MPHYSLAGDGRVLHTISMPPLFLVLLLAAPASAGEPPAPGFSLTVKDDLGEAAYRTKRKFWDSFTLEPVVKAGALALTESFPYPYPILKQSPFAMGGVKMTFSGPFEAMVTATVGGVNLRSHRLLDDPGLELATPAARYGGRDISQNQVVGSVYADVGKTFSVGGGWKGALYAAVDGIGWSTPGAKYGSDSLLEGNVGTSWLRRSGAHDLTLFADVAAEAAPKNGYRNDGNLTAVPSGRGGAEYAVNSGGSRYSAGVEAQTRRADDGLRPYLGIERGDLKALLALDLRRSKDPFYADSAAVAARVQAKVSRDLAAGVSGRYETKRFDMAPGPLNEARVTADLTWTPNDKLVVQSAKQWAARQKEEYSPSRQRELNTASLASPQSADVRALIAASPTLPDFLASYRPGDVKGILTALSEFTSLFSRYNYNDNEGSPPNLDAIDEIYRRTRGSYLSGAKDPTLVCLGAAQYAASLAEELGRLSGIPIAASATTVKTTDAQGRSGGHAVAQVKTKDMGIVFVDWGRIIPTYTFDTERSLRVYQALVGVPAVFHQVTDPSKNGRHTAYLFTEEGKLYVDTLTFHGESGRSPASNLFNDDPRGDQITTERYKNLLRKP